MKWWWTFVGLLLVIIVVGLLVLVFIPAPAKNQNANTPDNAALVPGNSSGSADLSSTIAVDTPTQGATVTSPLLLSGKALGSWYFEGTAPAALLDSNGSVIAQGTIVANGDWTSPTFVPFSGSIDFPLQPAGTNGTLVLTNDNPSGNPANQKTLDIPVKF